MSEEPRSPAWHPQVSAVVGGLVILALAGSLWLAQSTLGAGVLPHGYCLTWIPGLLWLHVVSDSLIALSYLSIPVTLLYFVRRRRDVPFRGMFVLFGAFIVACGATHAFDVWTLWNPDYWLSGGVKAVTAGVSVATALALVGIIPKALDLPSVQALTDARAQLEQEVQARYLVEAQLRAAQAELEALVAQRTAALSDATALLDAVFDAAPVGLAIFDAEDRYLRVNPTLARINGIAVAEHPGRSLHQIVPALADTVATHLAQVRRAGSALVGIEVSGPTAASAEPAVFRVSYFPVRANAGGALVGAVCEDISEQRAAEAERAILLRDAQDANRLKDEFMARVSHDLRTPLQALMSWVSVLRSGHLDAASTQRSLERIDHNVRLQARMISDLLDVARILSGKLDVQQAHFEPAEVVARCVETAAADALAKGVVVRLGDLGAGHLLYSDSQRLEQVVNNLLSNAIRYTGPGGEVDIETVWSDAAWSLTVRDTGIGIDADEMSHLFEPFRRGSGASAAQRGLGLGLAIARNIVTLMGGRLTAYSAGPGLGSAFTVRLPLGAANPASSGPTMPGGNVALAGVGVLFVEDDADVAEAAATSLRNLGAEVVVASEPDAALRLADTMRVDILVTDLQLGAGRTGYEVLQHVRTRWPELPAVVVSAYGGASDLAATAAAGFDRHLIKPVDASMLAATIAELVQRSSRAHTATPAAAMTKAPEAPPGD